MCIVQNLEAQSEGADGHHPGSGRLEPGVRVELSLYRWKCGKCSALLLYFVCVKKVSVCLFYVCGCFVCVYVCVPCVRLEVPGAGVTDGSEPPCGGQDLNPGPLHHLQFSMCS